MNAEQFHDALGMLPSDLITEADKRRSAPKKTVIYWRKIVTVAACAVLVLGCGLLFMDTVLPVTGDANKECAVEEEALMSYQNAAPAENPETAAGTTANAPAAEAPRAEADNSIFDMMEDVYAEPAVVLDAFDDGALADFAVTLFQNTAEEGENTLISPLSVMSALAMTANGADGETLTQMENAMGIPVSELNSYLCNYMASQTDQLKLANSIWFNDSSVLAVKEEFLQTNAGYYQADIFKAPMNMQTCRAINDWVEKKTDGMIPEILDKVPADAMMYLVNALAFDAEWPEIYLETSVTNAAFTKEDGTRQAAELMHSKETHYIEDELATGFIKPYKGGDYAFVALLPREGVSVADYVASLSGESLQEMLSNPLETTVYTAIPKFETEYDTDMAEVLKTMGMTDAFSAEKADFSRMGSCETGNLFISRVLHKTTITVAEQGTKAGAATVVEIRCGSAFIPEPKEVTLDRPFVYMLIDCKQNIPFFIGTLMDVES